MIILDQSFRNVERAWLDAALIDPAYAGLHCRLIVGDHGGIACDRIEGHRELDDENLTRLAEHAVIMTDPNGHDRLPVTTGDGHDARIVWNDDVTPPDRRMIRRPDSEINRPEPKRADGRRTRIMTALACAMPVLGIAVVALSLSNYREQPMMPIVLVVGNVMLMFLIVSTIRGRRRELDRRRVAWLPLAREAERRCMLPTCIMPHRDRSIDAEKAQTAPATTPKGRSAS
jgi:hypothetical protein